MPDPAQPAVSDHEAFVRNTQLMQGIVREMKEIPELPSEKAVDVHPLTHVEFPKEGILTYMEGHEHPYKGFPFYEFVDKIDTVKKVLRGTLSSLFHSLKKRSKFQLIFLIFVPWIFKDLVRSFLYTLYRAVERYRVKPVRYSTAVRELHRALSVPRDEKTIDQAERFMLRDILCMTFEFDNAYRYRFQDVIVELNKDALAKNPGKELIRLANLMSSREVKQEVKDTWTLLKYFFPLYLRVNRSFAKALVELLSGLDLTKVALMVEDKHYCAARTDYTFGFMQNPTEEDKKTIALSLLVKEISDKKETVMKESTKAHQEGAPEQQKDLDVLYNQKLADLETEYQNKKLIICQQSIST